MANELHGPVAQEMIFKYIFGIPNTHQAQQ